MLCRPASCEELTWLLLPYLLLLLAPASAAAPMLSAPLHMLSLLLPQPVLQLPAGAPVLLQAVLCAAPGTPAVLWVCRRPGSRGADPQLPGRHSCKHL
jgi:hypothetical protein